VSHPEEDLSIAAIKVIIILEKSLEVLTKLNRKLTDWDCHKIYEIIKNDHSLRAVLKRLRSHKTMETSVSLKAIADLVANEEVFVIKK